MRITAATAFLSALVAVTISAPAAGAPSTTPHPDNARARPWPRRPVRPSAIALRSRSLRGFRCGRIQVPFERADPSLGTTRIGFAVRNRSDRSRPSLGPIFAIEGGPGYSSTGSAKYYTRLFRDLLERHELVLVDTRGTGISDALRCGNSQQSKVALKQVVRLCATELGPRFFSYRTQAAAEDLEAVRQALGLGDIILYGDSYGTFLAQTYAYRHGDHIRRLVLDGSYQIAARAPGTSQLRARHCALTSLPTSPQCPRRIPSAPDPGGGQAAPRRRRCHAPPKRALDRGQLRRAPNLRRRRPPDTPLPRRRPEPLAGRRRADRHGRPARLLPRHGGRLLLTTTP